VSWSLPPSWSLSLLLEPCSTLLQPPLDFSPHRASLHHQPNSRSSTLFAPGCPLTDQQRTHYSTLLACASDQELQLLPGKSDGPVWHSGLFDFPGPRLFCPAGGQRVRNGRFLRSGVRDQNSEYVLTILGGSASVVVSIIRTTCPRRTRWVHHR
jgi:hypothetical protein